MPAQSSKPLRVCDNCYAILSKTDSPKTAPLAENSITNQGKPRPLRPCPPRPLSTVQELPETPPTPSETPPPRPPPPILFPTPIKDDLKDIPEIPKDEVQISIPARPPKLYELCQISHDDQDSFDMDDGHTAGVFCSVFLKIFVGKIQNFVLFLLEKYKFLC